ncbi:MAG: phenylalanine--tRNA ligase subunit beta [Chloroflexia bacterium]
MKVPLKWLQEYVSLDDLPVDVLAHRLTLAGLEVAGIERIGQEWDRERVLVGEVVEVRRHPNADRLTVVDVAFGAGPPLSVVCGAPNIRPGMRGQKVALARAGARLYDGHSREPRLITLKADKIRGVRSEGMICSEKELGLSEDHTGVVILPEDAPVGLPLADYLGEVILDIDLTPNLGRCYSMIGIAREVAALFGRELRRPSPNPQEAGPPIAGQVTVEILDPDLCPRYSAALVRDVQMGPSPAWMQQRLLRAGMRPINVVVDITNYVMLEFGQPLHAFDYDKLRPRPGQPHPPAIIVRRARPGERLTTLDGVERALDPDALLICDGQGPVALAGVMGGRESEVTETTRHILLESAHFDPICIRRTSQALHLSSEASIRFERSVDPEGTVWALRRACALLEELAGAVTALGVVDVYPRPYPPRTIVLPAGEVRRILGISLSAEEVAALLRPLGFACTVEGEAVRVEVPSFRMDVSLPADLLEEVARMYGYDRIPATLLRDILPPQRGNPLLELQEHIRDILVGCGLDEVITYSLTNLRSVSRLAPGMPEIDGSRYLRLANPLSPEREYLRQTLMAGLLEALALNLRSYERVALFEIGRIYLPREGEELPDEPPMLGLALAGRREERSWLSSDAGELDFFDLKGVVEVLLDRLGIVGARFEPSEHPSFHPGRQAALWLGEELAGRFGEVHPQVCAQFELPAHRVGLAEFHLRPFLSHAGWRPYEPLSRFPAVIQDIAVVVDEGVPAVRVAEVIRRSGGPLLRDIALFDVYRGSPLPEGKRSLAYRLTFQAMDRVLVEEEVNRLREKRIVPALERELGATIRAR